MRSNEPHVKAFTEIGELAPCFVESFYRASERRLLTLYDEVADGFGESLLEFADSGEGEFGVLSRVADLVGLHGVDLSQPLADSDDEAFAQRIAWRDTASWAVLSLLWALTHNVPTTMTSREWAEAERDGRKPRGGSSLSGSDESKALVLAAETLARSSIITGGCAMVLVRRAYVVRAHEGRIAACAGNPIALVETRSEFLSNSVELAVGDRVWLASPELVAGTKDCMQFVQKFALEGSYEIVNDGVFAMTGMGKLFLNDQIRALGVVNGWALLFG